MTLHPKLAMALGLTAVACPAFADAPPTGTAASSAGGRATPEAVVLGAGGARTFFYRDGAVYAVTARPGRITDIVLQPGERLVGTGPIAAGDTARWVIGDTTSGEGETRRVHVMLKPVEAGLATNLIINTDRRTYHLELRSTSKAWLSQVSWRYPVELPAVLPPPALKTSPPAEEAIPRLNFGYAIGGARTPWRPLRVFDDGMRTYVEFAPSIVMSDLPPLFGLGPDGKTAELLNYRISGHRIVVDRILDRAELRLGQGRSERRVRLVRETAP